MTHDLWRKLRTIGLAIVIIGVMLLLSRSILLASRRASCPNNLRNISIALRMYASDYGEWFPPNLSELYPDYISYLKVFQDPSGGGRLIESKSDIDSKDSSYVYIPGYHVESPPSLVIVIDRSMDNHRDGLYLLTLDGRVHWLAKGFSKDERPSSIRARFRFLYILDSVLIGILVIIIISWLWSKRQSRAM